MKDENMVSQSHFNMHGINRASNLTAPSLPNSYGKTNIFLMAVDPYSAHIMWEIDSHDMRIMEQKGCQPVVKLHDITGNTSYDQKPRASFEVDININSQKSYISLPRAGRTYSAELGIKNENSHFLSLAKSNSAEAPRDTSVTKPYLEKLSENNGPGMPAAASVAEQIPCGCAAPEEINAAKINPAIVSLKNRARFNGESINRINALEIIKNPPAIVSFLPRISMVSSFRLLDDASLDDSRLYKNPPQKTDQNGQDFDLTEFSEKRFISGISST